MRGDQALRLIDVNTNTVDTTLYIFGGNSPLGNGARNPVGFGDFLGAYYGSSSPGSSPFPVEWLGFDARTVGSDIKLNWQTAVEINNQGFEVDRSQDGRNWISLGRVSGQGTTSEAHSYQFIDRMAAPGQPYYYRLKQIDFDGKMSFSPRISATIPVEGQTQLYVDAASQQLHLTHTGGTGEILDLQGRVHSQFTVEAGINQVDLHRLSVGLYLLRITHPDGWTESHKFLK